MLHRITRSLGIVGSTLFVSAALANPAPAGDIPGSGARDLPAASSLTFEEARSAALSGSPELARQSARVAEARARLVAGRTYPHNPVAGIEAADRGGADGSSTDRALNLSQVVEIAGQRRRRTTVAEAALAAAEARFEHRRRQVLAAVDGAYAATVRSRELEAVANIDLRLTRDLLNFEERRLEAGAGTQIAVNLARAATGRAVRRHQRAAAAHREARARLAQVAGLDPARPPTVEGRLPGWAAPVPALDEMATTAIEARADLFAFRSDLEAAERDVGLQRSLAIPDLEIGAYVADEEGDDIVGVRAGIALPIFNRNQGGIAQARAAVDRAEAEVALEVLEVRRQVTVAHAHYQATAEALTALADLVVVNLEDSLDLLSKAVDAGELSATEVLLLRRELVEGRREHVEAAAELWLALVDLELAAATDLPDPVLDPSPSTPSPSPSREETPR